MAEAQEGPTHRDRVESVHVATELLLDTFKSSRAASADAPAPAPAPAVSSGKPQLRWRYDDVNVLAKFDPFRYASHSSAQEAADEIDRGAKAGRPIYVELFAGTYPMIEARNQSFPTKDEAVAWLRAVKDDGAGAASPVGLPKAQVDDATIAAGLIAATVCMQAMHDQGGATDEAAAASVEAALSSFQTANQEQDNAVAGTMVLAMMDAAGRDASVAEQNLELNEGAGKNEDEDEEGGPLQEPLTEEPKGLQTALDTVAGLPAGCRGDWDVARGRSKRGKVALALSTIPKATLNIMGGTAAALGWATAHVTTSIHRLVKEDACVAESLAFKAGLATWMYANGVFPTTVYDPVDGEQASDVRLTPIIVANHISYIDAPVLSNVLGTPRFVAKAGVKNAPVFGRLASDMDTVFVDREDGNSRGATIEAIRQHSDGWSKGNRPLLIFPEGTCAAGRALIPFKKGAFIPGCAVRPVLLHYTEKWSPASCGYIKEKDGSVSKYSDTEWAQQFMTHYMHSLTVTVMAPYIPSADEAKDAQLYADNVHKLMAARYAEITASDPVSFPLGKGADASASSAGGKGGGY